MTFQPIVPLGGLPGWALLNRTLDRQTEVFNQSPVLVRETDYFEQNIGNVRTPEDLVSDRRLLEVALGAFGLGDDINSQALLKRVLEGSTGDNDALVRLDEPVLDFAAVVVLQTSMVGAGRESCCG